MDSVRGYETSTLAGASGYLAMLELRHELAADWHGAWQGSVFADHGGLRVNPQDRPGRYGPNHASLSSVGLGLNWAGPQQWSAMLQVATPVGTSPELAGHRPSARAWVQVSKSF